MWGQDPWVHYFENSPAEPSPRALGSASPSPETGTSSPILRGRNGRGNRRCYYFENSHLRSTLGPKGLAAGLRTFLGSHFRAAWCAPAHGVYYENSSMSAGDCGPLLNARHEDGRGGTPARAERVLRFHACVVCAANMMSASRIDPAESSPTGL